MLASTLLTLIPWAPDPVVPWEPFKNDILEECCILAKYPLLAVSITVLLPTVTEPLWIVKLPDSASVNSSLPVPVVCLPILNVEAESLLLLSMLILTLSNEFIVRLSLYVPLSVDVILWLKLVP